MFIHHGLLKIMFTCVSSHCDQTRVDVTVHDSSRVLVGQKWGSWSHGRHCPHGMGFSQHEGTVKVFIFLKRNSMCSIVFKCVLGILALLLKCDKRWSVAKASWCAKKTYIKKVVSSPKHLTAGQGIFCAAELLFTIAFPQTAVKSILASYLTDSQKTPVSGHYTIHC